MSEEGTADRPARKERVLTRPEGPRVGSARTPALGATDTEVILRRLAGKPASEVLARISNGDPLRLYPRCVQRIRERFFVLDPDRAFEHALAVVAVGIEIEAERCVQPEWL